MNPAMFEAAAKEKTRVRGSADFFAPRIGGTRPLSSTTQLGWTLCSYEIAPARLVGKYYPYGSDRSGTPSSGEKFTGYVQDSETGLDYAINRYQQPGSGRFLTPDPYMASGGPGDPGSWNRYAYTRGDPVNRFDPRGTEDGDVPTFTVTGYCGDACDDGDGGGGDGGGGGGRQNPLPVLPTGDDVGGNAQTTGPSGLGSIFGPAQAAFQSDAKNIAKQKRFKKNCENDFAALKITDNQVRAAAGNAVFLNGVGSSVSLASTYATSPVASVAQAGSALTGTVGGFIASNPGTVALAQLGGKNIYINAGLINPADFFQDISVVLHELLHNITGLTDPDIQTALGLPSSDVTDNIAQKLKADCY